MTAQPEELQTMFEEERKKAKMFRKNATNLKKRSRSRNTDSDSIADRRYR
jgi:hypothetical protein